MSTTEEKFNFIIEQANNSIDSIHSDNGDCSNKTFVKWAERNIEIAEDYIGGLEALIGRDMLNLDACQYELECAIAEKKEKKRIAKLRKRKTSKGMCMSDFVHWAEHKKITDGKREFNSVHLCSLPGGSRSVFGHQCRSEVLSSGYIDTSKTWRIVK